MAKIIFTLFALASAAPPSKNKLILEGLVEGFISDRPDVKDCVGDSAIVLGDVEQALKDILKKDFLDAANGFRKLADALDEVPTEMKECKASEADVKNIVQVLEEFKGLKNFTVHVFEDVVVNFKDIVTEFVSSLTALIAGNFEECGRELGMALHRVVIGKEGPGPSPGPTPGSTFCKDHTGCSDLHPVDGLCCPVADGTRLACCDQSSNLPWVV